MPFGIRIKRGNPFLFSRFSDSFGHIVFPIASNRMLRMFAGPALSPINLVAPLLKPPEPRRLIGLFELIDQPLSKNAESVAAR